MHRRGMSKSPIRNPLSKILSVCLAVTILCSALIFGENVGATLAAEETNFDIEERVSDFPTLNNMGFVDIPLVHDGRIWTDKTVVDNPNAPDAFDVTFSALSQSFSFVAGYAIPSDIVIIIDVSGSMAQYSVPTGTTGTSRIAYLIDALNEAIDILMEANPLNRVAVVAYGGRSGGYARVEHVLGLGRYMRDPVNGTFFRVQTRNTLPSGTSNYVLVDAVVEPGSGGNRQTDRLAVIGSTPTQWGIYEGANILLNVPQGLVPGGTMVEVPVTDQFGNPEPSVTVTRRPNIILMTDGEPTMGWPNWAFDSTITDFGQNPLTPGSTGTQLDQTLGHFYGDGSHGELGVSLLNVLTAAHRKVLVHNRYFPTGATEGTAPGQPTPDVGFYNISLGDPTRELINAMMDPLNYADLVFPRSITGHPNPDASHPTYGGISMGDSLRYFAALLPGGGTIRFRALFREEFTEYNFNHVNSVVYIGNTAAVPITHNHIFVDYPTDFFAVDDVADLNEAFMDIAYSIQSATIIGNITNTTPEAADFDGWLVFSDVLGEYMEFRGNLSLMFPGFIGGSGPVTGTPIDLANSAVRSQFENILFEHFEFGTPGAAPDVTALIDASIAATGRTDSVRYFADRNRNFAGNYSASTPANADAVVEVFPMTGAVTSPLDGHSNDLIHIAFHLVTVLRGGTFYEIADVPGQYVSTNRPLAAGDQLVRWYIPASLIPMRNVSPHEDNFGEISGNIEPIRATFTVGLDTERVNAGVSARYQAENPAPGGRTYFYSNRWKAPQGATLGDNVTLAFYEPHAENPFYAGDTVGWADGRRGTVVKQVNRTGTANHVSMPGSFVTGADRTVMHWLGNNGRLTAELPGDLALTKAFTIDSVQGPFPPTDEGVEFVQPIAFRIFGPGFVGAQHRVFPADFTWDPVQRLYVMTNPLEDIEPGTYTVVKYGGAVTGGPGHGYEYITTPQVATVVVPPFGLATAAFINEYETRTEPPPPHGFVEIMKAFIFDGETGWVPEGMTFSPTITFAVSGPGIPADDPIILPFTDEYFRTCRERQAYTLIAPLELDPGVYTVTKTGGQAAGWYYLQQPQVATVRIENGTTGVVTFVNVYSTLPPDEQIPPTDMTDQAVVPLTGDENRIGLYIAVLLVAMFLIAATVVVYVRVKRRNN